MAFLTATHAPCRPARARRITLIHLMALARQRHALASLSDTRLEDLGLTRAQAVEESRRPFWDIPSQRSFGC